MPFNGDTNVISTTTPFSGVSPDLMQPGQIVTVVVSLSMHSGQFHPITQLTRNIDDVGATQPTIGRKNSCPYYDMEIIRLKS